MWLFGRGCHDACVTCFEKAEAQLGAPGRTKSAAKSAAAIYGAEELWPRLAISRLTISTMWAG